MLILCSLQINSGSGHGLVSLVPRGRWAGQLCPIQLLKAVKNETESQGMRASHVRGDERGSGSLFTFCRIIVISTIEERMKSSVIYSIFRFCFLGFTYSFQFLQLEHRPVCNADKERGKGSYSFFTYSHFYDRSRAFHTQSLMK